VENFSCGTEAKAFNLRAGTGFQACGLQVDTENPAATNPVYQVTYSVDALPLNCFSKLFDHPPNPTNSYCAVITCSHADHACPIVSSFDMRVAIR